MPPLKYDEIVNSVRFDWDDAKDESNRRKHGIAFETAKLAFDDPNCVLFVERIEEGEERWHAIGLIFNMPDHSGSYIPRRGLG